MPNFKPMLASPLNRDKIQAYLSQGPLMLSPKLDGIRALNPAGNLVTRSLKPVPNHYLRTIFQSYLHHDGELVAGDPWAEGVYHRTFSAVMTQEGEPQDVTFWVFDHLADKDAPYVERYTKLTNGAKVRCLPQKLIKTVEEMNEYERQFLEQGFEGAMVRRPNAPYKWGRATENSLDLMKVKNEHDAEAIIVDVYEAMENLNEAFTNELGHTDRSTHQENKQGLGMLGGFVLESNGQKFKCSAGKFDHSERIRLWGVRHALPGLLLKYRSFSYGVKDAPRFPRAVEFTAQALGFRSVLDL